MDIIIYYTVSVVIVAVVIAIIYRIRKHKRPVSLRPEMTELVSFFDFMKTEKVDSNTLKVSAGSTILITVGISQQGINLSIEGFIAADNRDISLNLSLPPYPGPTVIEDAINKAMDPYMQALRTTINRPEITFFQLMHEEVLHKELTNSCEDFFFAMERINISIQEMNSLSRDLSEDAKIAVKHYKLATKYVIEHHLALDYFIPIDSTAEDTQNFYSINQVMDKMEERAIWLRKQKPRFEDILEPINKATFLEKYQVALTKAK